MKRSRFLLGAAVASQLVLAGAASAGSYTGGTGIAPGTASISSVLGYTNSQTDINENDARANDPDSDSKETVRNWSWTTNTPWNDPPVPFSVLHKTRATGDTLHAEVDGQGTAKASVQFVAGLTVNTVAAPDAVFPLEANQPAVGINDVPVGTWTVNQPFNNRPVATGISIHAWARVHTNVRLNVVAGPNKVLGTTSVCSNTTQEIRVY